jgi:hypothetical protein
VQKTAADPVGRSEIVMKQFEGFTLRIEGNKVFINREPATPAENNMLNVAIAKVCATMIDSLARSAIMEGMKQNEK